ncbi:MAG: hypothetical protein Q4A28_02465 [Brachymonas sp.]|nr:hypothetical protein [Brachymonas sp.]
MNSMETAMQKNQELTQADAQKITPRAEFRVFGQGIIAQLEEAIWSARASLYAIRDMPVETYFVSRKANEANIKVRDELLDIKFKTGETAEGFEIFQPCGKFAFPLKAADFEQVMMQLAVELPCHQSACSFSDFLSMAKNHPDLRAAKVSKKRYGFSVDGVICEYAEVLINGAKMETACCEGEDCAKIQSVIESLGLAGMKNTSYIQAIKQVVGF